MTLFKAKKRCIYVGFVNIYKPKTEKHGLNNFWIADLTNLNQTGKFPLNRSDLLYPNWCNLQRWLVVSGNNVNMAPNIPIKVDQTILSSSSMLNAIKMPLSWQVVNNIQIPIQNMLFPGIHSTVWWFMLHGFMSNFPLISFRPKTRPQITVRPINFEKLKILRKLMWK